MKILVTGGAGFIGSHIVDAYLADGHEVVVLDNLSTGSRRNINSKAKFYEVDICDNRARDILLNEKPIILNHLAAQTDVRVSVVNPLNDIKVNVMGLVGLLEAGKAAGLRKVIFSSSGGTVYGDQEDYPATETHPTWPISPYGLNKLMCEKYLHYYWLQYKIPYVALRYSNVYGPRQNPHGEAGVVAIFLNILLSGRQPIINGDGKQTRDYIYISDVVEANRLALRDEAIGIYNVGTAIETDVNSVFLIINNICGLSCDKAHGPAKVGEQQRSSISSERLTREMGWRVTVPFAEGLQRTAEWFRLNGEFK